MDCSGWSKSHFLGTNSLCKCLKNGREVWWLVLVFQGSTDQLWTQSSRDLKHKNKWMSPLTKAIFSNHNKILLSLIVFNILFKSFPLNNFFSKHKITSYKSILKMDGLMFFFTYIEEVLMKRMSRRSVIETNGPQQWMKFLIVFY